MTIINKDQNAILKKLGITDLNPMQVKAQEIISAKSEVILLSATGTGKTVAFLLPLMSLLDSQLKEIQILILVPSRELAIQIEQVVREMGSGHKVNAVYGGRSGSKDKIELKHPPSILIGTPGRVADHIRRSIINTGHIKTLVLDEFDKSLEIGFEKEMKEIVSSLNAVTKKVLTSATQSIAIPKFIKINNPTVVNFLNEVKPKIKLKIVIASNKDKLKTLLQLIKYLGKKSGIVFCNFKDSIEYVRVFLEKNEIDHGCFYGGLEQKDREQALIKFRNGTHRLLIATDLAARGIDVPEMDFVIHYQHPTKEDAFIHRNGRTARMHSEGNAFVLQWKNEKLPDFIQGEEFSIEQSNLEYVEKEWDTLYISGGRRDKISKGDIVGLFIKQGQLEKSELGLIELKQECAYVCVAHKKTKQIIDKLNNKKLKNKKVKISLLK